MASNVEIISKEMIKPSSPTPNHLRIHKLSFLDQTAPPVYIPLIFFYQANQLGHAQISQLLKKSLSNVLTQFYPLAGKFSSENSSIDCTDSGALYVEAQVHSNLMGVIDNPILEEMKQYLPLDPSRRACAQGADEAKNIILAVQMNEFDCGGIAIAVQLSHKIADGTSLVTFMNAWAAICRGSDDAKIVSPDFMNLSNLFPTMDMSKFGYKPTTGMTKEKIVTQQFVFDKKKLAKLKQDASSDLGSRVKDPTRVEVVTAFFWKHFIETSKTEMVAAVHAVNMRSRMNPTLRDEAFGNMWTHTVARPMSEGEKGNHNLVGELRNAIRSIDSNYVKKLQSGDEYLKILKKSVELVHREDVELCNFSSWCRFPVYEVDFGWDKPTWVCTTTFPFKNVVILMSTSCGEGIEAWVNMLEQDMSSLLNDHMKLSRATKNFST